MAYAFFFAGMVKILGERFASGLSTIHPMGTYLTALHHTGYYYTFIGIAQVLAAVLLIIPRTVVLGALLYFPIILNICILSLAVRFEGSLVTSPLMVLANLYIIAWHYDKWRYILPYKNLKHWNIIERPKKYDKKFPFKFFSGVFLSTAIIVASLVLGYDVMPRNSLSDCKKQFENTQREAIGFVFCECVHIEGQPLDDCLNTFADAENELIQGD